MLNHKYIYIVFLLLVSCSHTNRYERNVSAITDIYMIGSKEYRVFEISDHKIYVSKTLAETKGTEIESALYWLGWELKYIQKVFPKKAYEKIKDIRLIFSLKHEKLPSIAFHPAKEWFLQEGFDKDTADFYVNSILITDIDNFTISRNFQKFMILHELAHAFFYSKLSEEVFNDIDSLYQKAKAKKLYRKVLHYNGHKLQAYAYQNAMEYFAEGSESYFALNDFYPFNRAELEEYDPELFNYLKNFWGDENSYYYKFRDKTKTDRRN